MPAIAAAEIGTAPTRASALAMRAGAPPSLPRAEVTAPTARTGAAVGTAAAWSCASRPCAPASAG
jgi:hypothetical protein